MKKINIISAIILMSSLAFAKPHPKKHRDFEAKNGRDHEKVESVKEAKIAKKIAKENNTRYRHEARERRGFNNM